MFLLVDSTKFRQNTRSHQMMHHTYIYTYMDTPTHTKVFELSFQNLSISTM